MRYSRLQEDSNLPGLSPSRSMARRAMPLGPARDIGTGRRGGLVASGRKEHLQHEWVVAALLPVTPEQATRAALRHRIRLAEVSVRALDVYCQNCRMNIADASELPCAARKSYASGARDHLTGGPLHERARRTGGPEADRAVVANRAKRGRERSREKERNRRKGGAA